MTDAPYSGAYYQGQGPAARRSAETIVPLVSALLSPRSVCDVGCGQGNWLAVFKEHGAERLLGIDGDYVERDKLQIDADEFLPADLEQGVPAAGEFDLAISLEVAEHLPGTSAAAFVEGLIRLAPAVLFSAAVPGQGGRLHVNEQWPEYWEELFARHGYVAVDCIRPRVWKSETVDVWYRQNVLLFASEPLIEAVAPLRAERERARANPLALVHPRTLEIALQRPWKLFRELAAEVEAGRITHEELEARMARMLERFAERARERSARP
jgi:SAM-dependent methyltransferase